MLLRRLKQLVQRALVRQDLFAANLYELWELLEASELQGRVWLVGGIVLGLVRDGRLLAHDVDADFAFLEEDHERFRRLIPVLIGAGFRPRYRWTNSEGRVTEYTFFKGGAQFEFFVHFLDPGRRRVRWYSYHRRKKLELEREIPWHGTRTVELLNRSWRIPERTEEYLEQNYGAWQVRDLNFDYTKAASVPCGRERRRWGGSCQWED